MSNYLQVHAIMTAMYEFQKENNVTGKCCQNSQYLYDSVKTMYPDARVKAVLVVFKNRLGAICVHMVVMIGKELFDPSIEVSSQDPVYFNNISDFLYGTGQIEPNIKRTLIEMYIDFIKFQDKVNRGDLYILDRSLYDKQADYVEDLFSNPIMQLLTKSKGFILVGQNFVKDQ